MNKKVVIIASAVLAFFAGAIWVDQVPVVASLVAFLEVCAGFVCGFFFHKVMTDEAVAKVKEETKSVAEATKKVKEELGENGYPLTRTSTTKSSPRPKKAKTA